jgi:60 kDa SS-A/Ro ribonucleoprotein
MEPNNAGGFGFKMDDWKKLDQFLVLGTEGGTYYVSQDKLTREALGTVEKLIAEDGSRVVARIVEISDAGRAVRNDPAIWALAACQVLGDEATKRAANAAHGQVVRTGTHLFQWATCMKALDTGWGRGIRKAIGRWYLDRGLDSLIYQLTKYRQRDGWTYRDVLRVGHVGSRQSTAAAPPKSFACPFCKAEAGDPCHTAGGQKLAKAHAARVRLRICAATSRALAWAAGKDEVLPILQSSDRLCAFEGLQQLGRSVKSGQGFNVKTVIDAIDQHRFTREMLPTNLLSQKGVWAALLEEMPMWAMLRNLGKMSSVGLLKPLSAAESTVCERLRDEHRVRRSRMHPAAVLQAMKVYAGGHGIRGSLSWTPSSGVVAALEDAFGLAFQTVEPSGQRIMLAIDASASMTWGACAGLDALTPIEGAAAMALAIARREQRYHILGFDTAIKTLGVSANSTLADVMGRLGHAGGTDGSLPISYALNQDLEVDAFVVMTDGETWAGKRHPCQALDAYRQKTGIAAKLIVVGMCANGVTFGDPEDAGTLDVVGFDAAAPRVIADFCRAAS